MVYDHGKASEITDDWYAQDKEGNVWYFGEDTASIQNGKKDTSGSFEAGRDGADAGIAMPAHPTVGLTYREEYYAGHAEDRSEVLALDQQVEAPAGHFTGAILTDDTSPIEPTSPSTSSTPGASGPWWRSRCPAKPSARTWSATPSRRR